VAHVVLTRFRGRRLSARFLRLSEEHDSGISAGPRHFVPRHGISENEGGSMTATSAIQERSEQATGKNAIRPFRVNVPEAELTELRRRIKFLHSSQFHLCAYASMFCGTCRKSRRGRPTTGRRTHVSAGHSEPGTRSDRRSRTWDPRLRRSACLDAQPILRGESHASQRSSVRCEPEERWLEKPSVQEVRGVYPRSGRQRFSGRTRVDPRGRMTGVVSGGR
jgi:hypothetical protein